MKRRRALAVSMTRAALAAVALALIASRSAGADGGVTADARSDHGAHAVAFVSPLAPRIGPIDVSVLHSPTPPADFVGPHVRATHLDSGIERSALAEPAHAGNRLLRSAMLELPRTGRWRIEIDRPGPVADDPLVVVRHHWPALSFEIEVSPPLPSWRSQWPWLFAWIPITAILCWRDRLRRLAMPTRYASPMRTSAAFRVSVLFPTATVAALLGSALIARTASAEPRQVAGVLTQDPFKKESAPSSAQAGVVGAAPADESASNSKAPKKPESPGDTSFLAPPLPGYAVMFILGGAVVALNLWSSKRTRAE